MLFENGNSAACTNLTDTSVFTLMTVATVRAVNLWVDSSISGPSLSYSLFGPDGDLLSSGSMTKGACDPYQKQWCQFSVTLNSTLGAGNYTVKTSATATCSNSGSNYVGFVSVTGCAGPAAVRDAGCPYGGAKYGGGCADAMSAATCNNKIFDNGNTGACTTPTDTSVFTLTAPATVTAIHLWVNTTISGQSLSYTLSSTPGAALSSGAMIKGSCDPYQTNWCDFSASMNLTLAAGAYTVKTSAKATCSNAGSSSVGFVSVWGCAGTASKTPDAGCAFGGGAYGGCSDAALANTCNTTLFDNGNTAACTTLVDSSTFTLSATSTVTYIRLWENTTVSGQAVTYQLFNSSGGLISAGPTSKGGCDPYQTNWCEFLVNTNLVLPAGNYSVRSSAKAICANSGSNNLGQVIVRGCAGGSVSVDAGCPYGGAKYGGCAGGAVATPDAGQGDTGTCSGVIFDNWNTMACTTPTDATVFALTGTSTITGLQIWVNTTVSATVPSYTLTNAAGTLVSSGSMTKDGCDPYQTAWCAFQASLNTILPAGTYTLKSSTKATCSNSGSSNNGFLRVMGCGGATTVDAGAIPVDSAVAPLALCTGATAYFPFSEGAGTTTADGVAAQVGTLTGNVAWVAGKLGNGVGLNGSNYVSVPDVVGLDPGLSDFALSAWVRIPATTCQHSRLITHGTHGQPGHDGYALMEWGGGWGAVPCGGVALLVGSDSKAGEWLVGTCTAMNDGLLHHYVGVVNRTGTMDLYVDGVKVVAPCTGLSGSAAWGPGGARDISPLASVSLAPTCALCIGASCQNSGACGTPSEFFSGTIDEFAFWKRALSPTDVSTAYALGVGKAVCP